jgi:hypothetical protein
MPLCFRNGHAQDFVALLDGIDDILALDHLSEDGVLGVQIAGFDVGDEKLAAIGAGSGICHGQRADCVNVGLALDLVVEAVAWAACTGTLRATALDHEVGDHAMEIDAVVELVRGEEDEVIDGDGFILGVQFADDFAARGVERRGVLLLGVYGYGRRGRVVFGHALYSLTPHPNASNTRNEKGRQVTKKSWCFACIRYAEAGT